MRQLAALGLLAAALGVAGCTALATQPGATAALPAAYLHAVAPQPAALVPVRDDLAIDRWWRVFDDAALERLMDEVLAHNADLDLAHARVREAEAVLAATLGDRQPTLDLQAAHDRARLGAAGPVPLPPGVGRTASSHSIALAAGYDVDLWGRLASAGTAARQQLLASQWARASVQWRLTAQVAETYYQLLAVLRQTQISEAVRIGRESTVELREREHRAGAGSEFNLRRAQAELTGTQADLAALGLSRAALERALLILSGRAPRDMGLALPLGALVEYLPFTPVLPQGAAAQWLVRRPDVREAEARLAAAHADVATARAQALPSLRLTGVAGSDTASLSDLFSGPAFVWSVGASITHSLLDGGRARERVRAEQAQAEHAVARYRLVISAAFADLREAYERLDLAERALQARRDQVLALERSRELARRGYESGAFAYLDLLDAERSWYQAQLQHVNAYRDQRLAQVAAFKALGGGYEPLPAGG